MEELLEALAAIAGLGFSGFVILLIAPTLDSMAPVNLTAWGVLLVSGGVVLTIVLIIVVVKNLVSGL